MSLGLPPDPNIGRLGNEPTAAYVLNLTQEKSQEKSGVMPNVPDLDIMVTPRTEKKIESQDFHRRLVRNLAKLRVDIREDSQAKVTHYTIFASTVDWNDFQNPTFRNSLQVILGWAEQRSHKDPEWNVFIDIQPSPFPNA